MNRLPDFQKAARDRLDGLTAHQPAERPPLVAVDVHDLAKMTFKPRDPLLGPWLNSQNLVMVHAARGLGKTHYALAVAYAVATGGDFLKWKAPAARKVVYLDGELPGVVWQERLGMHVPEREPAIGFLRTFTPDLPEMEGRALPDLSTREGQAEIDAMIEPDTALVIVDNLSAWVRSGSENEAEGWLPVADWVLRLRRRGVAVLLVHHDGKGGSQRGTSKKEDLLDAVLHLKRPTDYDARQGARFTVTFSKARHLVGDEAESLEVTMVEGESGQAVWTWKRSEDSTFERVVELANTEGMNGTDIAAELGLNKSTVSRHLRRAREEGRIKGR